MLEWDLIWQRERQYKTSTALLSDERREALRRQIVAEYGAELEQIVPLKPAERRHKKGSKLGVQVLAGD